MATFNPTIENRKAYHDYFVLSTLECGIELKGHEVKSVRNGSCSINDAWCAVKNNELIIHNMFIDSYSTTNEFDILNNRRDRKLLVHKQEIRNISSKLIDNGITLIPLKAYFTNGRLKILLGICKGKHNYDKRQTLKDKAIKRDIEHERKNFA